MKHSITMGEKVGYSLGDVAANLAFQMMMIYQLKFYTDIFGLDGAIAGTVLLIAPLASAFADPFIGIITDRTQTRWGKYRPWILWTALPFSIFYILAFWNPGIQDKTLVAIYATVSYILLLTLYGFNNTPYASLGGVMTDDIRERTSINKVRFVCTSIAQFVVQGFTLPLVDRFGNGNPAQGWQRTIILFAVLAFIFLIICFLSTRERIQPPPQQKMSIREDVSKTFSSVPWRSIFVLVLFMFIALAMWGASTNFYFQSYLDQSALSQFLGRLGFSTSSENAYIIGFSLFNTVNAVVQFLGVLFLSGFLANRFGKKTTFLAGLSLCTFFTALFYLPSPQDIGMVYLLCLLKSLAYGPTIPLLWAMVADTADHMEYINHRRATGFCFSGVIFALKTGMGIGGAFAGLILSLFGFVSGFGIQQSETTVTGIRLVSSLFPALLLIVGIIALYFYPISKSYNEKMQAELAHRRHSKEND